MHAGIHPSPGARYEEQCTSDCTVKGQMLSYYGNLLSIVQVQLVIGIGEKCTHDLILTVIHNILQNGGRKCEGK